MNVLLIDDRLRENYVLVRLLRDRGVAVHAVSDGKQALEMAASNGPFDYVISDHMLGPDFLSNEFQNGQFILSEISKSCTQTRTVLFTMSDMRSEELAQGVDKFISKQSSGVTKLLDWIESDIARRSAIEQ